MKHDTWVSIVRVVWGLTVTLFVVTGSLYMARSHGFLSVWGPLLSVVVVIGGIYLSEERQN